MSPTELKMQTTIHLQSKREYCPRLLCKVNVNVNNNNNNSLFTPREQLQLPTFTLQMYCGLHFQFILCIISYDQKVFGSR
jgi:hypothetical protein